MYNRWPQYTGSIVDLPTVAVFQSKLTHLAKQQASLGNPGWRQYYADCTEIMRMFDT